MEGQQVFENIHGGHNAVHQFTHQNPYHSGEVIVAIGHRNRIASDVGDTACRMIRRQNIQPAVWRQTLTPLAEFRCAQRTIRIFHPNLSDARDGRGCQKIIGSKIRIQALTARKNTFSKISTPRDGAPEAHHSSKPEPQRELECPDLVPGTHYPAWLFQLAARSHRLQLRLIRKRALAMDGRSRTLTSRLSQRGSRPGP